MKSLMDSPSVAAMRRFAALWALHATVDQNQQHCAHCIGAAADGSRDCAMQIWYVLPETG